MMLVLKITIKRGIKYDRGPDWHFIENLGVARI